jgi:hypothetical protein
VFDETVYPFAKLNPNTDAHLRNEITLLPCYSNSYHDGACLIDNYLTLSLIDNDLTLTNLHTNDYLSTDADHVYV